MRIFPRVLKGYKDILTSFKLNVEMLYVEKSKLAL